MGKRIIFEKIILFYLAALLLLLAVATFLERFQKEAFAENPLYGTWGFVALWGILFFGLLFYAVNQRLYKRPMPFLLHLAFWVILSGAFLTFTTSTRGTIHLREGIPCRAFEDENTHVWHTFPFEITLTRFQILCYPGTQSPSDYVSRIRIQDPRGESDGRISMNKIYAKDGYRFYQLNYDPDLKGSVLMVKKDRLGLPVTYAGYALLCVGMVGFFFSKKTMFRKLLKQGTFKRTAMVLLLGIACHAAIAGERTLPKETARRFGEIQMLYKGRIVPIQTFAEEFTLKLYGKKKYQDYTPEQVLWGWILYPGDWMDVPLIKVKSQEIRKILGLEGKYASFSDFFIDSATYKLAAPIQRIPCEGSLAEKAGLRAADEKVELIMMLRAGIPLTIFPKKTGDGWTWYSPADTLHGDLPGEELLLIKGSVVILRHYAREEDLPGMETLLAALKIFQQKEAGEVLPPAAKIKAEILYNRLHNVKPIALANVLAGFLALGYFSWRRRKEKGGLPFKTVFRLLNEFLLFSGTALLFLMILRGYVEGRLPLGTGYETLQFLAVVILLLAFLFQRKFSLFLPFGLLFSGLVLVVSFMGSSNPRITQLMPVLHSPWLSIHISLIMMSYALFGFVAFNALTALSRLILSRKKTPIPELDRQMEEQAVVSRILLYPAVFLLAAGIFVGAVWAEVSWGSYWSWDPKEVWALITLFVYIIALHPVAASYMKNPLTFHIYTLLALLSVLMTYFGVNYILGGQHSYGVLSSYGSLLAISLTIVALFIAVPVTARIFYKRREMEAKNSGSTVKSRN